jgi:type IV pilus assembly protein PilB
MSNLDLAEHFKPQDGRARLLVDMQGIDLRVSVLPTSFGETMVLRILNSNSVILSIDKLGFTDVIYQRIKKILAHEQGFILVTGPTGSGKTTTLYAMLNELKSPDVNMVTIEDPVEYRMENVNQVQVNEKQGLTFPGILRSVLRQDPDIILVGEIRDDETADIAFQAAMTGHLVFSTLHTNDAVASITRLVDLGVERFKLAGALIAITAQRLVRKLCPHCKQLVPLEKKSVAMLDILGKRNLKNDYYGPVGCAKCEYMGYKGRVSVVELLDVDSEIKKLISENASEEAIKNNAKAKNMLWTLTEDALIHLTQGVTSLDEIMSFIPVGQELGPDIKNTAFEDESPERKPLRGKKKILIADDDQSIRIITKKYLEEGGFEVLEARDGIEAIDIVVQNMPDLLLLDLMMPKLDGISVIKRIKQTMGLIELPIIVLTAVDDMESQTDVINLGADDYIIKPFNPKLLAARVNALFRRLDDK